MKNTIFKYLFLILFLFLISFVVIIIKGCTYNVKISFPYSITDIDDVNIQIEQKNDNIIIADKEYNDNILTLTLKGNKKGKAYLNVSYLDYTNLNVFYIHNFNIITENEFLGKCSGDIIIIISTIIINIAFIFLSLKKYLSNVRKNIYQYKNIFNLGMILFLICTLIIQVLKLPNYSGLNDLLKSFIYSFHLSIIFLPIVFISFITVTISNIKLIIKEGFKIKNMLGVVLGLFFCFFTILPEILYSLTYSNMLISIHEIGSIGYFIYLFVETLIYIIITYLECILFGTIIIAIKSSLQNPNYDKDYIIILGCMIKSDGSLTPLLKGRVDKALEFYGKQKEISGKELIFVPSGGKGSNEIISEAEAMKKYLLEKGISSEQILVENKSCNTYENITFSNKLIKNKKKDAKIIFSTTKYHVFRAGIIATNKNISVEGIGSNTKPYFWINAFIREFIAALFSEKKKHILVLLIIVIISLLLIFLIGISEVL